MTIAARLRPALSTVLRATLPAALTLALASCATPQRTGAPVAVAPEATEAARPLRLASWNLEFLAEKDGMGCSPRTAQEYAAMRRIADSLDADVIAFQEAETVAAAARVFDPARYTIVMEERPGAPSGTCGGKHPEQKFIRQAVGFAIRKGLTFERHADVTALMLGNPQLRSGVDVTISPADGTPIRLLAVHLKSGCFSGNTAGACATLLAQVPVVEGWIDAAAKGPTRFAVLGDWNRRLALPGDPVWREIDDQDPENADLRLADEGIKPSCDPRYGDFIDHIVFDKRAGQAMQQFRETPYAPGEPHYSDHCPIAVTLTR